MAPQPKFVTFFLWIALLGSVFIEISGFRTSHILSQRVWTHAGAQRGEYYAGAFLLLSVGFGLLGRRYFIPAILGAAVLCSAFVVGPIPVGAVLLFVFSATLLGRLAFGRDFEGPLAFLGGTAIWILAMTCMVRFPVNYPATYLVLLAVPIAWSYRLARQLAGKWVAVFRPAWTPSPTEFGSLALLALVMVAHWLLVLKPEVGADGLAMHMAAASNIAIHHAFTIDFRHFIWALMPMGADWCYSVLYVLGGEYAARLLNLAMLAAIGWLILSVASRFVPKAVALLMVFLFVSTPLVQLVTTSLMVENFVAAMTLGAAVALWRYYDDATARSLLLSSVLLGVSLVIKLGALAVVAIILPFLFMVMWRNRRRLKHGLPIQVCAVAILITIGLIPYANAYWQSGNPVFPFENARFHSPYYSDSNLIDERFRQPLTWRTPALLTFRTQRYFEGHNGSFGLQYLLFLPLILACWIGMRSFPGRSAAVIGLGSALVIAKTLPNARYFYPTLPFLTLGAAAAWSTIITRRKRIFQASVFAATVAGLLNIYVLPSASWYNPDFFPLPLFSAVGRQAYLEKQAPVRELVAYVNRVDRTNPVAFTDGPSIAGLIAPAYSAHGYDYQFQNQVQASEDPQDLFRLLAQLGVRRLIVEPSDTRYKSIEALLAKCVQPEYSISGYAVERLVPDCELRLRAVDTEPLISGRFDETDPRVTFIGTWTEGRKLPFAYQKTVAWSDRAGAQIRFRFTGSGLRYTFTRAYNRGIAEIIIDGVEGTRKSTVDLYGPDIVWQAHERIADLAPGDHNVTIRALHEKNPRANGYYIDIDSIEILDESKKHPDLKSRRETEVPPPAPVVRR